MIDKSSLAYRLLVPIFTVIIAVSLTLLLLISLISNHIIDEYYRSALAGFAEESKSYLDTALVELSTARLLDNQTVLEAKQRAVLDVLQLNWQVQSVYGVVIGPDEKVIFSALSPEQTERIASHPLNQLFTTDESGRVMRGLGIGFPAWNWKIYLTTVGIPGHAGQDTLFLVPLVAIGTVLMVASLFLILQKRLRGPVATMVTSLHSEQAIGRTGVSEFDEIGSAMNVALNRVKERTEAVLHKDQHIQLLLDSTAEGIYGIDLNGDCTFCNASCLSLLGYGHEQEMLGRNLHALVHYSYPDGRHYQNEDCPIYSAFRAGKEVHVDHEVFWRKDGSSFPVEYWSYPIVKDGTVVGAVVTFIDISQRKRSEAALREERNKFEAIIAAIGDGISIQDRNYRVLYQNDVHKGMAGNCIGELCYKAYEQRNSPCDECPIMLSFKDGRVHSLERAVQKEGEERHFEITASPLRDASGEIVAGIELVRDITARKRTEAQLRQAQKMEAVGRLAGGIAHDFNNVLSAIVGYASLIKKHVPAESQPLFFTTQVLEAAERGTRLTRQILAFSRKQVLIPRPVAMNEIVQGMVPLLTRILGEDIEVRVDLPARDMTILADTSQIEQVLMNLATNARDAMPRGGKLIIKVEQMSVDGAYAVLNGLEKAGRYGVLSVSDTGAGMDEQTKSRIFEPFFTTKDAGRGTGLGLSIVYGIIRQHNGHVSVYSEPGTGTTFRIYLPLAKTDAEARKDESVHDVPGGTETILIAEDNIGVSGAIKTSLEEHGYRVLECANGEEAVRLFTRHAEEVRLCLFDVIMPQMNGKSAFQQISAIKSTVRVIYMSGYTADVIEASDLVDQKAAFLSKPINPRDLLVLVRQTLDRV